MNNLAPRQGIFAIILLVSFCLHVLMLMFSIEKQQYDSRTDKGEKIVEQLSREALAAIANQDRISLSVLASRYQVDSDVAKLVISDQNKQPLVQTGQSQTESGQVIDQPIIQHNQVLGHATVTMKAISKGEIVGGQWLYILGSAILHGFLWLIYGYLARPTQEQLALIGEKVQQRLAISRGRLADRNSADADLVIAGGEADSLADEITNKPDGSQKIGKSITDFLHDRKLTTDSQDGEQVVENANTNVTPSPTTLSGFASSQKTSTIEVQIRFFDQFNLLHRIAPELSKPYFQLCQELLERACDSLFGAEYGVLNRYIRQVDVKRPLHFTEKGAVVHLVGREDQLPIASVLLAKLVIILNQVVYEKHRELSRFALPMTVGASLDQQFDDVHKLMKNYAKEDGLILLYPQTMLKSLNGQVQLKNLPHPTNLAEREMVWYSGLAESLMTELINKRDAILTASDKAQPERDW